MRPPVILILGTQLVLALALMGCNASRPWASREARAWRQTPLPAEPAACTVFLIGDAGKSDSLHPQPGLGLLRLLVHSAGSQGTQRAIVFLGDNVYDHGLPAEQHPEYAAMRHRLMAQLSVGHRFQGPVVFIPGNHDWANADTAGWRNVQRQERFVELHGAPNTWFVPDGACPWPTRLDVGPWAVVAFNFDYFLYPHRAAYFAAPDCRCPDVPWAAVRDSLATLMAEAKAQAKPLLVLNHHPLHSNGAHGGRFTLPEHLFPLRVAKKWLWVPLPVLGSAYPILRRASRHFTDLANPTYAALAHDMRQMLAQHPNAVYACGHEHVLQYNREQPEGAPGPYHHLLSGAGSKHSHVRTGLGATFAFAAQGLVVLHSYADGQTWAEYVAAKRRSRSLQPEVVFRARLF